ncbi:hypothetical protein M434DRAFT_35450 [Hypoxylon sp. CO27-5]|nr:hypothetical protein M434DRAFT_35450 [Hypoxylon sp. CO27-5]
MAEESNNEHAAAQRLVVGDGLRLAFDGFTFGDWPIRGFAMDALMTPIEGIQPGDLTVYNNALSLLSAAFSAKEKWTKDSEEKFKSEIEDMWGLASSNTALFLVKRFITARRRFQYDHRGIRDFIFPWEKNLGRTQKADGPIVKNALKCIRSSLVKPQWETDVVGLLTPDPGALPTTRPVAEENRSAFVSSEDLAALLQDEFIKQGLLENPVYHECITKVINSNLDPPTRTKLWQMIIEARRGHSSDRLTQVVCNEVCNGIFRTFSSASSMQKEVDQSVSTLKTWAARLELPPLNATELRSCKNEEEDNYGEAKIAGGEDNGVNGNDKDNDDDDDYEVIIILSEKRKAENVSVSESKRRR